MVRCHGSDKNTNGKIRESFITFERNEIKRWPKRVQVSSLWLLSFGLNRLSWIWMTAEIQAKYKNSKSRVFTNLTLYHFIGGILGWLIREKVVLPRRRKERYIARSMRSCDGGNTMTQTWLRLWARGPPCTTITWCNVWMCLYVARGFA